MVAFIGLINTKYHPADIPSRPEVYPESCRASIINQMIKHISYHPALISYQAEAFNQDTGRDAWFTPYWIRSVLRHSPQPPSFDLFADATNAITRKFCSIQNPFTVEHLDGKDVYFYQPPYSTMGSTWQQCNSVMTTASSTGFWGLVPLHFFQQVIQPQLMQHCCYCSLQVDYKHPCHHAPPGASFRSLLFFLSPTCVCDYLEQSQSSANLHAAPSSRKADLHLANPSSQSQRSH